VAEAIPKNTYLHDPHVTKEPPTEDTAAAVIHVVDIVETGTVETEIMIEETGMAIEEIEVSIVDEAIEADITTVATTEEASVVAEEEGDSEVVIEEDGTEVLDIVVVGLQAMLPPVDLQEISLSTHRPVLLAEEEVDTKTNTVVARTMSLSVLVLVWAHPLDLSLLPQDKNILVDMTIDDVTRTGGGTERDHHRSHGRERSDRNGDDRRSSHRREYEDGGSRRQEDDRSPKRRRY